VLTGKVKQLAERLVDLYARVTAPGLGVAARRGIGARHYMRHGALPVPLHYYQPVFDPATIDVWDRRHPMPGIDWREDGQLQLLDVLGSFGRECVWPEEPGEGYYAQSPSFGYSSAALLHAMVRHLEPARVMEIGAGSSTLIFAAALAANGTGELMSVDPNPAEQVADLPTEVDARRVETLPVDTFQQLGSGDVLFIDSSHVLRTGGDVNYLYLDVLPTLRPGVVVHVHDIQLPYEYPASGPPRVFWTEQYLLQAMLAHSDRYRVLLAGYWVQHDHPDRFQRAFPHWRPERHRVGSSFYLTVT
jgi:hypothetical protein